MTGESSPDRPTLQLVRGDAEPEELAALLAVLSARGSGAPTAPAERPRLGRWADPASGVSRSIRPGADAWRGSGRPRG